MRVGVLGGGQLARMLALEGIPLGHRFTFLEPAPDPPAAALGEVVDTAYDDPAGLARIAAATDVVTYEFENVPAAAAAYLAARLPVLPPPPALEATQDRLVEKRLFRELGSRPPRSTLSTRATTWTPPSPSPACPPCSRRGDSATTARGRRSYTRLEEAAAAVATLGPGLIAEGFVGFSRELSVLGVGACDGGRVFYPLTENRHRDGILRVSRAPAPGLTPELQARAEGLAARVMDRLGYVGVLAIELFQVGDRLMANEMAPRVHNSGHWTLDGASVSQFENHVRAVTGLALAEPRVPGPAAMVNIIGEPPDPADVAALPFAHLHLYDKAPRPGRKLGHVNITGPCEGEVAEGVQRVREMLTG